MVQEYIEGVDDLCDGRDVIENIIIINMVKLYVNSYLAAHITFVKEDIVPQMILHQRVAQ